MSISVPHLSLSSNPSRCFTFSSQCQSRRTYLRVGFLKCSGAYSEQLACDHEEISPPNGGGESEIEKLKFDAQGAAVFGAHVDSKHLNSPVVEVKELQELPEQWRRAKLAWLCKELPIQSAATIIRLLRAQKKWMRQEDATYIVVHCLRVRRNETAYKVYKWMEEQHWYLFDFALATKLADHLGKEGKLLKCRELFDSIIDAGRVPSESTFHVLIVAYISAEEEVCLDEACGIYHRMVHLGGYQPRLTLHHSLFKALVSKPGNYAKRYLEHAEFIYHNLKTFGLEVHKDIYGGLIWLHSYQGSWNRERMMTIWEEMKARGIQDSKAVLLSVLRACSKAGDVDEAERVWQKLIEFDEVPPQAYLYKMEAYATAGHVMKSFEIFRNLKKRHDFENAAAYHKIIEVLCKSHETDLAESVMQEFIASDLTPLLPSIVVMLNMYLNLGLDDKLESLFSRSLEICTPNQAAYSLFLDSLVKTRKLDKAEETFTYMYSNTNLGVSERSCNTILECYLSFGDQEKVEKVYNLMCQKKYEVDSSLKDKLVDVRRLNRKEAKKPMKLSLSKEQREAIVGLLLGGLQIRSDEKKKMYVVHFEFSERSTMHSVLRTKLYALFREWLHPSCIQSEGSACHNVPYRFFTVPHSCFGIYAEEFWQSNKPTIPKLIHRWLSPQVLAYWFMYAGHKTPSGDILLKSRTSSEEVEKVINAFTARSLNCEVKRKGRVFWLGFLGSHSTTFWELVERYIFNELKDSKLTGNENFVGSESEVVFDDTK